MLLNLQIDVGAGGNFVFNPANVTAPNGTLITFFFPGYMLTPVSLLAVADCSFQRRCPTFCYPR